MKQQKPEERTLLRFLRRESLASSLVDCRIKDIAAIASQQMVLTPLAHRILDEESSPESWRKWAASVSIAAEKQQERYSSALRKTVCILNEKKIEGIVLKGASLSLGRPRDSGDVDLLIPKEALGKAIESIESAGYEYKGFERNIFIRPNEYKDWQRLNSWSVQYEFLEPETKMLVELHTAFFETDRVYDEDLRKLRASIGEFVTASVLDEETGFRFLAKEDRVFLLALHAGIKRSPANKSFVLRHLLDLETLMSAGLDWDKIVSRAFELDMAHHLLLLMLLYERISATAAPRGLLQSIEERLPTSVARLVNLHARCIRNIDDYSTALCLAYRIASPFVLRCTPRARIRAAFLLPVILPTPYQLQNEYHLPARGPLVFLLSPLVLLRLLVQFVGRIARSATASRRK
jgi:hypothetical protein